MISSFLSSDWNKSEYEKKGGRMSDWIPGRKVLELVTKDDITGKLVRLKTRTRESNQIDFYN